MKRPAINDPGILQAAVNGILKKVMRIYNLPAKNEKEIEESLLRTLTHFFRFENHLPDSYRVLKYMEEQEHWINVGSTLGDLMDEAESIAMQEHSKWVKRWVRWHNIKPYHQEKETVTATIAGRPTEAIVVAIDLDKATYHLIKTSAAKAKRQIRYLKTFEEVEGWINAKERNPKMESPAMPRSEEAEIRLTA